MSDQQLATFRQLRLKLKAARDRYHAALAAKAADAIRHQAERDCSAAMDALKVFQAGL
jgi:hypothetical protein